VQSDTPVFSAGVFALRRATPHRWLVQAPCPFLPAVIAVAAVEEPSYAGAKWRSANTVVAMRSFPLPHAAKSRADYGDVSWRDDLLQLAKLIDTLSPDRDDPEAFCIKKNAVSHELRRLARWRPPQ
jgi:hypothetical protein